ncbi:MAG: DUF4364 family protein [Clostridiales bacterium]|nr:DUF4364 family protein [Clostridiales bacterium]
MKASLKNKRDIKIFILYLLNFVGRPIRYAQLHDICVYDGLVGSFDFTECLDELVDADNILRVIDGGEEYYSITPQGVRVSRTLSSDLLRSIRETGRRAAVRLLDFSADGSEFSSSVGGEDDDGGCGFECEVKRGGRTLMRLEISAASVSEAEYMKNSFDSDPEGVMRSVYEMLTGAGRTGRGDDPDAETYRA